MEEAREEGEPRDARNRKKWVSYKVRNGIGRIGCWGGKRKVSRERRRERKKYRGCLAKEGQRGETLQRREEQKGQRKEQDEM